MLVVGCKEARTIKELKAVKRAVKLSGNGIENYVFDIEQNSRIEKIYYGESQLLGRNFVLIYHRNGMVQKFFDLDYVAYL